MFRANFVLVSESIIWFWYQHIPNIRFWVQSKRYDELGSEVMDLYPMVSLLCTVFNIQGLNIPRLNPRLMREMTELFDWFTSKWFPTQLIAFAVFLLGTYLLFVVKLEVIGFLCTIYHMNIVFTKFQRDLFSIRGHMDYV